MAVSASFRAFVLDQLGRVATGLRAKSMFGGVGLYAGELFFALVDDDVLYLKADPESRREFEVAGMEPFRPGGEGGEVTGYYAIAGDLLEDVDALKPWVDRALAAAGRKRRKRKRP